MFVDHRPIGTPLRRRVWSGAVPVGLAVLCVAATLCAGAGLAAGAPSSPGAPRAGVATAMPTASATSADPAPTAAPSASTAVSAGAVVRTLLPNYNGSLEGNFAGSVRGWQVGSPAYVPSTGSLWLPQRSVAAGGLPPPSVAPAVEFNATTNAFVGIAPWLDNTSAFLFDPVNDVLYSADYGNNTVGVLNASNGAWLAPAIPVGAAPSALALDPSNNLLYVANSGSNNVTVINATVNLVANPGIATGLSPHALALDQRDQTLFVADGGDANIWTINLITDTLGSKIPLPGVPAGVAYSEPGSSVAATVPSKATLTMLNATTLSVFALPSVGIGAIPIEVDSNGTQFIVGNGSGSGLLTVSALSGNVLGTSIATGQDVTQVFAPPNDTEVFSWQATGRNLTLSSLVDGMPMAVSPTLGLEPESLSYDPQSNWLLVAEAQNQTVVFLNATTGATVAPQIRFSSTVQSVALDASTGIAYAGLAQAVVSFYASTGQVVATDSALVGGNSPLLVDPLDGYLWVANGPRGLQALHLTTLIPAINVGIPTGFVSQQTMAFDPSDHTLFVLNTTSGDLEAVNGTTGVVEAGAIPAGTGVRSVAYDPADGIVYALGDNVTLINATTYSVVGSTVPIAPHVGATGITYDPSRELLYATTTGGSPGSEGTVSVLDGSSVSASSSMLVTIPVGQLPTDPVAVAAGGVAAAPSDLYVANLQSGSVSVIATPPALSLFAATPSPVDVGESTTFVAGTTGGTAPFSIVYSGLPPGCASVSTLHLNCTPTSTGTYRVTVTLTDALDLVANASTDLSVMPSLAAQLVVSPSPLADLREALTFQAVVSGGLANYSATWAFGDGSSATGLLALHAYFIAGTYVARATVTDQTGATTTLVRLITVEPLPASSIVANPSAETDVGVYLGLSATVTGGTGLATANWTFGDGANASGLSTVHAWSGPGNYTVTFAYRDTAGVWANATRNITVNPRPVGTFYAVGLNGTKSVPAGSPVEFRAVFVDGTQPYRVNWSFGDGSFALGTDVVHTYGAPAAYEVNVSLVDAAGVAIRVTLPLSVTPGIAPPAVVPITSTFVSGIFLGALAGGTVAAVVLFAAGRARRRPPPPPAPFVVPRKTETPGGPDRKE